MRIGIASWIIQDGNYPDFAVGDVRTFALEFHAEPFSVLKTAAITSAYQKNCKYDITGQIFFRQDELTIIDFGHVAYSEQKLGATVGDWVTGQFYIGVDPFMYFEHWSRKPGVPEIRREWRIERIFLETTPLIEQQPRYFVRDASRFSEVEVAKTNAWDDDKGNASYTLECTEMKPA